MVSIDHTHILRTKVQALPENGAVEKVPTTHSQSGFFSRFFFVPKKDSSLRPILDLHVLNRSLMKLLFKMLTAKRIIAQIHPGDWFISVDRKDVYFHAPTQTTLEIRVRGDSIPIHGPTLWALSRPAYIYQMSGCCTCPSETDAHLHFELSRQLADFSSLRTENMHKQGHHPAAFGEFGDQNQLWQDLANSHSTNCILRHEA